MNTKLGRVREFFDQPDRYLRFTPNIRLRATIVRGMLDGGTWTRMLDAGCGDGSISLQFRAPGRSITLLDLSRAMLDRARAQAGDDGEGLRFVESDLASFERESPFDVILCLGLLAHVEDVSRAMERLASWLAPGGRLIVQVTDRASTVARIGAVSYALRQRIAGGRHYELNRLTRDGVVAEGGRVGLALLAERRYSLLLPGMGLLSPSLLENYERAVLARPWLAKHGSEVILMFGSRPT